MTTRMTATPKTKTTRMTANTKTKTTRMTAKTKTKATRMTANTKTKTTIMTAKTKTKTTRLTKTETHTRTLKNTKTKLISKNCPLKYSWRDLSAQTCDNRTSSCIYLDRLSLGEGNIVFIWMTYCLLGKEMLPLFHEILLSFE